MKKPLLALLAVAAVAIVAVVIVENTPERRMDRRYDKLLRSHEDDPKQLYQKVVDDRDLLGFALVNSFLECKGLDRFCSCDATTTSELPISFFDHKEDCDYRTYLKQHWELFHDFWAQIGAEFCDCTFFYSGHREVFFSRHPEDCNFARAWQDVWTTWGPYILRKTKEYREAWVNR